MNLTFKKAKQLKGTITLPGDKSLSHRVLLFGALAEGKTVVTGLSQGEDVQSTGRCLQALGIKIEISSAQVVVTGSGLSGFKPASEPLNCGNSGSTIRMLMGILAGQDFTTRLVGDASLSKRPMGRVAEPLRQMGAEIELTQAKFAPITITGHWPLKPIHFVLPVASAQVKSALMLAALYAEGESKLTGKIQSRDHSERLLPHFGAKLNVTDRAITLNGGQTLTANSFHVPGDPSSAAFWLAAACIVPQGEVLIKNVLLNPTRTGFQKALQRMGATIDEETVAQHPEPVGHVQARWASLKGIQIEEAEVASLIDEIPMLAVLATYAHGVTEVRGAEELRVKESDRIEAVAENLRRMGAKIETFNDGFRIQGPQPLKGAVLDSFGDHRIAMAFAIGALGASGDTQIQGCDSVNISYPTFFATLQGLVNGN